jgi:N-acetylmuramoyl-L-alanine amidase
MSAPADLTPTPAARAVAYRSFGLSSRAPSVYDGARGSGSSRARRGARLRALAPALLGLALATPAAAAPVLVDYQRHLGPRFARVPRRETRYIVVHSTEAPLASALRTLSRGRVRRGRPVTPGGHANYLVARNGTIYRILDPRYRADHAGLSMWKGRENLSDVSIGVELEGYHDEPFTSRQYVSLRWLLGVLRRRFHVAARDVLEHYRVAYTRPNRFYSRPWRGRKRDPGLGNFDRRRAGLDDEYRVDPDVAAGRLGGERLASPPATLRAAASGSRPAARRVRGGTLGAGRTAWSVAGPRYRSATTLYVLPDGTSQRGDEVLHWDRLPAGTEVYVDLREPADGVLSRARTAWRIAGGDYDAATTLYLFPDGSARRGDEVLNWSDVPEGTRVFLDVPDAVS